MLISGMGGASVVPAAVVAGYRVARVFGLSDGKSGLVGLACGGFMLLATLRRA